MAIYTVVKVRKELSSDRSHRHIAGVIDTEGAYHPRGDVVRSIEAGNTWQTSAGGYKATIHKLTYCFRTNCYATPYIETNRDSSRLDNLENLPEG